VLAVMNLRLLIIPGVLISEDYSFMRFS